MKAKILSISLAVGLIASLLVVKVQAAVDYSKEIQSYPQTVQTAPENYDINIPGGKIKVGDGTSQFTPSMQFESLLFQSTIGLTLALPGNQAARTLRNSILNPDGSISVSNNAFALTYRPVSVKPGFNEGGGLDFILQLKLQPPINTLSFTYNSQNVTAYFQPPLTAQEIAEGTWQPDHINNSIAFYSNSLVNNQYKTGKVGHLYRPYVYDALGNVTWADWAIVNSNTVTLTVSQTWLATAIYPVTLMPVGDTFGYTSQGGGTNPLENTMQGLLATPGGAGTVTSISAYLNGTGTTQLYKYGLYDGTDFIANGSSNEGTFDATNGLHTQNMAVNASITAIEYAITAWGSSAVGTLNVYRDSTAGYTRKTASVTYGAWSDPVTWGTDGANQRVSIYATYTLGGETPTFIPKVIWSKSIDADFADLIADRCAGEKNLTKSLLSSSG